MIYANEKNRLWNLCQVSMKMINALIKQIKGSGMETEKFVRTWIDNLYKVIEDYDTAIEEKEVPEDYLKIKVEQSVNDIDSLWDQLESYKNEQWVLDFTDKLNSISVRY